MKIYKWGIIGPGKIANKFATALTLAGGASLEAVASRDADRARTFAETHGANGPHAIPRIYTDYAALAADPSIDAVYIATPHGFHAEHALLCLRQGKAVLCEKPMALSNSQVREMVDASRAHNAFLMEAMWTRFIPLMGKVLELTGKTHSLNIQTGAPRTGESRVGAIKYIRADFGFPAPFNPDGRLFNMRLGGGSLLDIGIYPLFLALQLLGEPDSIRAAGQLSPTGSDQTCHAVLLYRNGASAVISSTVTCQTSITAEIAGTEGMIRIPAPWYKNDRLALQRAGEEEQTISVEPMVNGFEYQIRETQRCLGFGLLESPLMPHAFSLMMSRVMDAIRAQIGVVYEGE